MSHNSFRQESGYVNIHGDDVEVFVCEKTGRILVPFEEFKNIGFHLYRKSQYSKLLIDDSQFTDEFHLYMLEAAQTYMLEHKITFREEEIIERINKIKQKLTGNSEKTDFTKSHKVQSTDENISVTTSLREPSALTVKNLHSYTKGLPQNSPNFHQNNPNFHQNKRVSLQNDMKFSGGSSGSFGSGRRSEGVRNQRNGFDNTPRNAQQGDGATALTSPPKFPREDATTPVSQSRFPRADGNAHMSQSKFQRADTASPTSQSKFTRSKTDLNLKKNEDKGSQNGGSVFRERLPQIELKKPQHNVRVVFVERPNYVWVQDVDNDDILVDIDKKVDEEAKRASTNPKYMVNKIFLAQDEGTWYRCKIIKFKPLTVFFVDYGNTAEVSQLKEASEELGAIPCQAVKININDPGIKPDFGMTLQIEIKSQREGGTYVVKVVGSGDKTPSIKPEPELNPEPEAPKEETFFDKPDPMCTLEDNQKVVVVAVKDGILTLRTKECYSKFRKIEAALKEVKPTPVQRVLPGQLVLCNKNDGLYRAMVAGVRGSSVDVEFLDYKENINVNISSLRNIPENLACEPITYIVTPKIKGYVAGSEQKIKDLIEKQTKAIVVLNGKEFDLKVGEELMSNKLSGESDDSGRIMLQDLERYEPKLGVDQYILNSMKSTNDLSFCHDEFFQEVIDVVYKTEMDDQQPYNPIVGEVCYGCFEDIWSRCVIIGRNDYRYSVKFIDFGNEVTLTKDQIRKATSDMTKAPIIEVPCKLTGVPTVKNCEELVKNHLALLESYEVNVKKFNGEKYEIEIPSLYEKLRSG